MKLSILILCYNCKPLESKTIQSLLNSSVFLSSLGSGINLTIWNNGPKYWSEQDIAPISITGVFIKQTLENKPIGKLYNSFTSSFESDYYLYLDHDTLLNEKFIYDILTQNSIKIGVPIIRFDKENIFPICRRQFSNGPFLKKDKVYSIASGLLLSKIVVEFISEEYGNTFDNRYAFYGVDTSFFIRLHALELCNDITVLPAIMHSLSRLEAEEPNIVKFRTRERSLEAGITLRNYFSIGRLYGVIRMTLKSFFLKDGWGGYYILKGFVYGKHPRCN
jgi:hypothetical protein